MSWWQEFWLSLCLIGLVMAVTLFLAYVITDSSVRSRSVDTIWQEATHSDDGRAS